jgi:hypothetical protein
MRKLNLTPFVVLVLMLMSVGMSAQNALWKKASSTEVRGLTTAERNSIPKEYNLFQLNTTALKNRLANAPERFTTLSDVIIELPTNNGDLQRFRVYDASTLAPELQAKHPNIRSYAGQGIDDPTAVARFSVSDIGMNVMITSANYSKIYIDPYTTDRNYYISYNTDQITETSGFECLVEDDMSPRLSLEEMENMEQNRNANDGKLRTFRLALACTGEYAQFHLNNQGVSPTATDAVKKAAVLSAMNVAMTRVNGIYEQDLSVTMVIVPNNEEIIYLNAATDPYTNNSGVAMLGQNQTTVDTKIGAANYDIGHVFSTGGGGIAGLRVPCLNGQKARGVTGLPQPIGDNFYIDFVSHEMGHQFGANHTFNNACGGNRNNGTAVEPGSGTTIMSYAGICPPNVLGHSEGYFHAVSIAEIWSNLIYGNSQCGAQTNTNNAAPVANAGENYTIPKSTPFILEGSATDPDGTDGLTHNWEQTNPQSAPMPPENTSTLGPLFRSVKPSSESHRYMPMISTVLGGDTESRWEVVPSVGRVMNFRYTVRDNAAGGGSSDSANMKVTVDGNSGPFVITSHNSPSTWTTGTTETVTWDVAGSDASPVNCSNVDILFSTDNGSTYPVLIATVPNTGSAVINVPNLNTTTGRMMIRGSGNIFYDLNDAKIVVEGTVGTDDFSFEDFTVYPNPSNGIFNLKFTPDSVENIEVSLYDLRGRLINQTIYDEASTGVFNRQLDYSYIDTGMYLLVVKNGDKKATKKLIKK